MAHINYDLILMIIPIGFIIGLYPMACGKPKFFMSKATIMMYMGLLALQATVFYAMELTISSALTFINAGAWILVWRKNLRTDQMQN
jgi:hypothetical protein